jgi:hypothetical protein
MAASEWKFTEAQRDSVSKGEICPKCLGGNVKCTGSAPDFMRMNHLYECQDPTCKEGWEGY